MFAERMELLRVRLAEAEPLMPKSSKVTDTNILSVADVELDSVFQKNRSWCLVTNSILQPGMVLTVDGPVSVKKTFRAQVGDSFIVTEKGYEPLTEFAKDLEDVVC